LPRHSRLLSSLIGVLLFFSFALASAASNIATVQKVRFSQTAEKVRIVFDFNTTAPTFDAVLEKEPLRLVVDMNAGVKQGVALQTELNDPFVKGLTLEEIEPGRIRAVVDLKQTIAQNVFILRNPNRLVIDLAKVFYQKNEEVVMPGIKHLTLLKSYPFGPVEAHVLKIDHDSGFKLVPMISNGEVKGLEPLSAMSARAKAIAAVNGSYFSLNGEIIGLLKLDGNIVSTPTIPRTAVGIRPDGTMFIGPAVDYQGEVALPDGQVVAINGVNRERYADEIILYNKYYGPSTESNDFGIELVVELSGVVTDITRGKTKIPPDCIVISGHGKGEAALKGVQIGDRVLVTETLGPAWDKTIHALGAGPTLVKNGNVFLNTKIENFGSDVAGGRAPRTALGLTKDGSIILAVVDGRRSGSAGLSLLELAFFMQELGAVDAMNLDGGGSSEMIINDVIVNTPSDGRERNIGDGLAVIPTGLVN